ncbi:MAG: O-antigen ligase family protein, partial [Tepidisphaeraceae bacterium]
SDLFAAVIGACHFVAAIALLWAGAQCVRTWAALRLVASACAGLLLVFVAHGLIYRFVEVPDLRRSYEQNRDEFLHQRGWQPGSFLEQQFTRKVLSGEMIGFSASPNSFAATLVMLSVISAALVIQRIRDGDGPMWGVAGAFAVPTAVIIYLTQSRAAYVSPILAVAALVIWLVAGPLLARWRRALFIAAMIMLVCGALVLVAMGIRHGGLGQDSLTFRWRYWAGSARLIAAHPILGVGWNNFGASYLAHRLPEAAEEIKDPHNLLVRMVSELGIPGGVLLIVWLVGLAWGLVRRRDGVEPQSTPVRGDSSHAWTSLLGLCGLAFGINIVASVDFSQTPSFVVIELLKRLLLAFLMSIALIVGSLRNLREPLADDRPAPFLLAAIVVGLAVFLLHNLIDFSLFETGPMLLFMLLGGAALGIGACDSRILRARPAWFGGALTVWIALGGVVVAPVVVAESKAQRADLLLRERRSAAAAGLLLESLDTLPFVNSDYAYRAARALMFADARPEDVISSLGVAVASDPTNTMARRTRAMYELSRANPDAGRVRADYDAVVALNPNDVQTRIDFADALEKLGLLREADEQIRTAIRCNDALPVEEPKRLSPERIEQLRRRTHP